jgi:hypothetical protein
MVIRVKTKMQKLLEDPANVGPDNPSTVILNNLNFEYKPWDYDLCSRLLHWVVTYLIPGSNLTLPVPAELDFVAILSELFNDLPAHDLLEILKEGQQVLEDTLTNVQEARLTDANSLKKQQIWVEELKRRLASMEGFIVRAEHNAMVLDESDDDNDIEEVFCPFCQKRNSFNNGITCEHYICRVGDNGEDLNGFEWMQNQPHFFNEVSQFNRSIKHPKITPELFETLVEEAPTDIADLLKLIRKDGSDYWINYEGVESDCWDVGGLGTTTTLYDYFHRNPTDLIARVKAEVKAGLEWLEKSHPKILAEFINYEGYYVDKYTGEWGEGRAWYLYEDDDEGEDENEDEEYL